MRRLSGIGVSPGAVCGRAVILIQRAHVLRYQIAQTRVSEELARLGRSRQRSREQLLDIRARVGRRRGPDLASLFDAQLLMVEDPMLVPRAETIVPLIAPADAPATMANGEGRSRRTGISATRLSTPAW